MKAWDTVIVKADATVKTQVTDDSGTRTVQTPHPHAGRAGVVESAKYDREGKPLSCVAKLDHTQDGADYERVELLADDIEVKHVF